MCSSTRNTSTTTLAALALLRSRVNGSAAAWQRPSAHWTDGQRAVLMSCLLILALSAEAQRTIVVQAILEEDEPKGMVRFALCPDASAYATDHGCSCMSAKASSPITEVRFDDVPEGQFAIKAFHDEDVDGRLSCGLMGMPKERYGFSNNARGLFGPPSFKDAAVQYAPSGALRIQLR